MMPKNNLLEEASAGVEPDRPAKDVGPNIAASASRGLDWLNLWVANIQTGFGPFIAVYLTSRSWTQTDIGLALSLGTLTAMASQLPAGALVDRTANKSRVASFSIVAFAASALLLAIDPAPLSVYGAEILHGFSSCTLGPAIAAMSLALAGQAALGQRLGRNARFSSVGNGIGAALMGACGQYVSERAVFFLTAAITLPALAALVPLWRLRTDDDQGYRTQPLAKQTRPSLWRVCTDRRLLIFAGAATLFTLSDSAMLPLAASTLTKQATTDTKLLIAACIVVPQVIVALISPTVGRLTESLGRRPVMLLGFAMLPLRGLVFAAGVAPVPAILVQMLNGIESASFLIMVPLITSDVTGRSGHFNLALGFVGFAIGIGGTLSTTLGGWIADHYGDPAAFMGLAAIGLIATLLVLIAMPETRPEPAH
jgi:MFS family permease